MAINQQSQIKRNACGSIDTTHYETVARETRSGFAVSLVLNLFKIMGAGFHPRDASDPANIGAAFKRINRSNEIGQRHGTSASAERSLAA